MNFFSEINAQQGQLLSGGTPVLVSLTVSGPTEVEENTSAQYVCTANYSDGSHAAVSPVWSENSTYTTIDTNGLLTVAQYAPTQNVTVTASYGGKVYTYAITTTNNQPTLDRITIEGPTSVLDGSETQYLCRADWSNGSHTYVSPVWSDNAVWATITSAGILQAGVPQHVTKDENVVITAIRGGKVDTHSVTILHVP